MSIRESDSLRSRMEIGNALVFNAQRECPNCGTDRLHPRSFRDCDHDGCLIQICPVCSIRDKTASCQYPGCDYLNLCSKHYIHVVDWNFCHNHAVTALRTILATKDEPDGNRALAEYFVGGKR